MNLLVNKYNDLVDKLSLLKFNLANELDALENMEYNLSLLRAKIEKSIVDTHGGAKAVGTSADDRERVFLLGLQENHEYANALRDFRNRQLMINRLRIEKEELEERIKIIQLESDGLMIGTMADLANALTTTLSR